MIPLKLELRNFMSYGSEGATLDMTGMHTLCLAGENGNGKSALLDAITWALWGESRAGKNKHDDLVRLGADEMSVTLIFEMDGTVYRVLRKRSKKASGNLWELQQQAAPDKWHSLTKENSAQTEAAIRKLLRMNYDTFLNSAYLKQGQADQFVRQTPGKRKEILADILDLSRYDQLEAKARVRAKEAAEATVDLERDLSGIDAELAEEASHQEAIAELQVRLEARQAEGELLKTEIYAVLGRLQELDTQKQAADALRAQADTYARELAEYAIDGTALRQEIGDAEALLAQRVRITRDYNALLDLRQQLELLDRNVSEWHRGQRALAETQREWDAAEHSLRAQVQRAADAHAEAAGSVRELPELKKERDAAAKHVAMHEAAAAQEAVLEQQLADAQERMSVLKQEDARLTEQARNWEERLAALAQQQETCRVCNAPLSPERTATVRREYQDALDDIALRRKDGRAEGLRAKSDLTAVQEQLAARRAAQKEATAARVRLGQVEQQLLQMETRAADVPRLAAHLAEVSSLLESGRFAPEIQARLERIQKGLARYEGAEGAQATAKVQIAALAPSERQHLELAHAEKTQEKAQTQLARTETLIRQREDARAVVTQQLSALSETGPQWDTLTQRREELKTLEAARRASRSEIEQEIGRHRHALDRCTSLRQARVEKEKALAETRRVQEMHDQLAKAFGKKGVQALIIENALPELQDEANRLLERLTDGDMSLYIDTLREARTKREGPIETLDVRVSDSLGTRPLEMYSGGEGFRAAFALRLALSKLLARRAGARLQTLIIDEGFGTQDGKGREKLVDALNAIGDDFEKIIVITHIDELKDAFPARIEIVKTPNGSQITVMEGGAG